MKPNYLFKTTIIVILSFVATYNWAQCQMEKLDRGVVAVRTGNNNFVSWRWLGTEDEITFNLYRNGVKVNATPLTASNYTDAGAATNATYVVKALVNGIEQTGSAAASVWGAQYLNIPIQAPPIIPNPDNVAYTYNANDASVADLDGDGEWEIILKWDPSNSKDNSQAGYTGPTYIDAYKLNGTRLWRINFGRNIRAGAHYLDFMVYDFDGDGKAEMIARTAEATIDGAGIVIGSATADYRTKPNAAGVGGGYVLTGPEYVTVFNGQTGRAMASKPLYPPRGVVADWGDAYGNRVDRFKACVAYLDGKRPSGVFIRGYYAKWGAEAIDWRNGQLTSRWTYMCPNDRTNPCYEEGAHSVSVADVDGDGKQEIITGSLILDDNGTMYYNTTIGHGDALHVSDLDPDLDGLEISHIQEPVGNAGLYMYSGKNKTVLWRIPSGVGVTEGPGRGVCADISSTYKGAESWAAGGGVSGVYTCKGVRTNLANPSSTNFLMWWDGDLQRELNNGTTIDKYGAGRLLTATGTSSNNGTKSTPCLSGDIMGDWREELIVRTSDNTALRIYTTNIPSTFKFRTLMHDPQYRVAIAWQNTGYNQPPHLSYYLGGEMTTPAKPNITIVGSVPNQLPTSSITAPVNNALFVAPASVAINANAADADGTITNVQFYNGATLIGADATAPYSFTWTNVVAGTYTITSKATDNNGAVTSSSPITIVVKMPNVAPVVSITLPINNTVATAPATFTINSNATDSDGTISIVEFFNGSTLLGSDATAPYSFVWTNVAVGTYSITTKATDNSGASTTSNAVTIISNSLPIVNLTAPLSNTSFIAPASISIAANATDANGTVTNVEFYNGATLLGSDATAPYTFVWTNVLVGNYSITAKAIDNSGASTVSSLVTIVVKATNVAPTVSITTPVNNTSFITPASITINANAADSDGTISIVEFYNGITLLGSDATSPYSFVWANATVGTYSISAKAIDNSGAATTTGITTIALTNPPSVTIQAETACFVDGILLEITNIGFNGTGYVNTTNGVGSGISFTLNSTKVQTISLNIRFANASAMNRAMSLSVNGALQIASIGFPSTGNWTTWNTATTSIALTSGINTLKLVSLTAEGGPNVDELTYTPGTVSAGICAPAPAAQSTPVLALTQAVIAPNPTSSSYSLSVSEAVQSYTITNSMGTIVITGGAITAGSAVNFGETLINGLFTLRIQYSNGRVETKTIQKIM